MDINEINQHIEKLKNDDTSWQSVERLAILCTVRNELTDSANVSTSAEPLADSNSRMIASQSDFVEAASAVPFSALMSILDAHMNGIQLVYPKEYQLVMSQLAEIKRQV